MRSIYYNFTRLVLFDNTSSLKNNKFSMSLTAIVEDMRIKVSAASNFWNMKFNLIMQLSFNSDYLTLFKKMGFLILM